MLIRFSLSNFCSFKDSVEFSMIPTREKLHRDWHLFSSSSSSGRDLLRVSVLYGANASGKSNFIKAFEFAVRIITKGIRPNRAISCPTFKLDKTFKKRPTRFHFEIQTLEKMYSYEFHLSNDAVLFEKLSELTKTSEKIAYTRNYEEGSTKIDFGDGVDKRNKEFTEYLQFVANGTRKNQLFLTETIERNVDLFSPVYEWFSESIKILSPKSIGHGIEFRLGKDKSFTEFLLELLSEADPSITHIDTDTVDADTVNYIPSKVLQQVDSEIDDDGAIFIANIVDGHRSVIMKEDGELKVLKMFIQRKCHDSNENVTFDLEEESDGTRRLIDLAPLFFELLYSENPVVAFVDELDRSLHPLVTKSLLEVFLRKSATHGSMSQIIISTHNSVLFDQDLLRRDEVWILEKEKGASRLLSLQRDFSPRYDKDIRKEYLLGTYGGIPRGKRSKLFSDVFKDF